MITLHFYETNKAYGCFSNFSRHPVVLGGRTWATTEHFFQAAKFSDAGDVDAVHAAPTPFAAAQIGRERTRRSMRPDWPAVRDEVMLTALRAKFAQHPDLASVLASTRGAMLVEHTANDACWGDGGDGHGLNRLGRLLEQVRAELPPAPASFVAPPWIQQPEIDPADIFWRMGKGEDCLGEAHAFWSGLPPPARKEYDQYFAVPPAWTHSWN